MNINNESPWSAEAPRQVSFDIPEGIFPAQLLHISVIQNPNQVRDGKDHKWTFEVNVPGKEDTKFLAIRRFAQTVEAGSELRYTLGDWVGEGFFETDGNPVEFYPLRDRKDCLVWIRHHNNAGYKKPAVVPYKFYNVDSFENVHRLIGEHSFKESQNVILEHLKH